ncbi:MAG: GFA family protein [Tahibacter sp.]
MNGSCACGSVTFRAGDALQFVNCHCTLCRGLNGSAFSSYVVVREDSFVVAGSDALCSHTVTDRTTKFFCGKCGTPICNANPTTYPGLRMLYLGTLANASELRPGMNIFCSSKLDWVDSMASLHGFAEAPTRGG